MNTSSTNHSPLLTYLLTLPPFRRLPSLYSDFNPTTNPDNYSANISTWRSALSSAALAGVLPSSSPSQSTKRNGGGEGGGASKVTIEINEELLRSLETREWGRPVGLGWVVGESVKEGGWMRVGEFKGREESLYTKKGWRVPGPLSVAAWGLRTLGVMNSVDTRIRGRLVIIENLEVVAGKVVAVFESMEGSKMGRVGRVISRREFSKIIGEEERLSSSDLELVLKFLSRDKGILTHTSETIKFKSQSEVKATPVTEEDTTIANLKELIKDLETQLTTLTTRIESLTLSAKVAVSKKQRIIALSALRNKKIAEGQLEKRHATLQQLEEVFHSIEQAETQIELVKVLEGSTVVLKGLNKEVGGVERVDDVVDKLREEMSTVEEVSGVINSAGESNVDEGVIDEEFEKMMEEENRKEREEKEKKEEEEMERKMEELERFEREARVRAQVLAKEKEKEEAERKRKEDEEKEKEKERELELEEVLNRSTDEMKGLSLEGGKEKEGEILPAS